MNTLSIDPTAASTCPTGVTETHTVTTQALHIMFDVRSPAATVMEAMTPPTAIYITRTPTTTPGAGTREAASLLTPGNYNFFQQYKDAIARVREENGIETEPQPAVLRYMYRAMAILVATTWLKIALWYLRNLYLLIMGRERLPPGPFYQAVGRGLVNELGPERRWLLRIAVHLGWGFFMVSVLWRFALLSLQMAVLEW